MCVTKQELGNEWRKFNKHNSGLWSLAVMKTMALLAFLVCGFAIGCGETAPPVEQISVSPEAAESLAELSPVEPAATDWPWWRGPTFDGKAAVDQTPPITWSETENVVWKVDVPGRGHGSPSIWGDRIFLATADEEAEVQSVLCYSRTTGDKLWEKEIHRGGFMNCTF